MMRMMHRDETKEGAVRFSFDPLETLQEPLTEGWIPGAPEGYIPEPYEDPEIYETDTYAVDDKEEFYNYPTTCKHCGTRFIAYSPDTELVHRFCPGCGKELT